MDCIDTKTFKCLYCNDIFELKEELTNDDIINLNRAEHYRKHIRYDEAIECYEEILKAYPDNIIALWGAFLSEYGIEYVDDYDGTKVPTCHRTSFKPVHGDKYYKLLPPSYQKKASVVEELRQKIVAKIEKLPPYDVFICYKAKDGKGYPTKESKWGRKLYERLTYQKGLKVFFAEETLVGNNMEYEAQIYSALVSSKLMFVLASSLDNVSSPWVKNEWTRFHEMQKAHPEKVLRVVSANIEPYDLPRELQHSQVIDYDNMDFEKHIFNAVDDIFVDKEAEKKKREQEEKEKRQREEEAQRQRQKEEQERLQRELEERLSKKFEQQAPSTANYTPTGGASLSGLLKKARLEIADGDYQKATQTLEKAMEIDAMTGEIYFLKLLIDLKLKEEKQLEKYSDHPIDQEKNYRKALQYSHGEEKKKYENYSQAINTNIKQNSYDNAIYLKESKKFAKAKEIFVSLGDFLDAPKQIEECDEAVYQQACIEIEKEEFSKAIKKFSTIEEYKNVAELKSLCIENEKKNIIYIQAITLLGMTQYREAVTLFSSIKGYKNSNKLQEKCDILDKEQRIAKARRNYEHAVVFCEDKNYEEALKEINCAFIQLRGLDNFENAKELLSLCRKKRQEIIAQKEKKAKREKNKGILTIFSLIVVAIIALIVFTASCANNKEEPHVITGNKTNSAYILEEVEPF